MKRSNREFFFFSSRRRHTRFKCDWSSDVCSSDLKFAQDKNVPFTNYASLCRAPEVQELIGKEVEAVNKKFARVETIKKFRLIDQLLTAEDEELTPTMKLKRSLVEKKYGGLIKD